MPPIDRHRPHHGHHGCCPGPHRHHGSGPWCRDCDPDADLWNVGELVLDLIVALLAAAAWLIRRPVVLASLAVLALAAALITVR